VLEKYLEDKKTPHHPIITAFNYEPGNPNKFIGNYHCEALLAAIIALGLPHNNLPGFLGEHWKKNLITVSKLCCPVCWDLLALLKINGEHPVVRGRHPSLSPVDLPPWLPTGTVTAMVALYRNRLLKELAAMVSSKHK